MMTSIAAALLGLALQLLIAAQQPNVPTEVRIKAVQTATYAIEYAQASMPDETPKEVLKTTNSDEISNEIVAAPTPSAPVEDKSSEAPYGIQPDLSNDKGTYKVPDGEVEYH